MEPLKSSAQSSVPSSTPSSGHRLAPSCDQDSLPPADSDAATAHLTHQTSAVSSNATASLLNAQLPPPGTDDDVNASSPLYLPRFHIRNPSAAGLSLQTDLCHEMRPASSDATNKSTAEGNSGDLRHSATAPIPIHDGYLRSALYTASNEALSPASLLSSPALNALTDLTPLPSPLVMSDSPAGPWAHAGMNIRPRSRGASTSSRDDTLVMLSKGSLSPSPSLKKKGYQMLRNAAHQAADATQQKNDAAHGRNRSLSEFKPDALHNIGARHVTISNVAPEQMEVNLIAGTTLHREAYLAAQRGLISAAVNAGIPTPPASNRSVTESEEEDISEDDKIHYITVRQGSQMTKKLWRPVRVLGQGTFSKVWLATDEKRPAKDSLEESTLDPHRLAAIKVVERGPAGGADEERVQLSLKREVEMLRSISHPSLVHLRAFDQGEKQALIVLTYCPGGDLFDVASTHHKLLSLSLVQRIFAEMISATQYLHNQLIVHRDIKLENILLNIPVSTLPLLKDPKSHPYPLATLTDFGLSRRIPVAPESPLLSTRCGSEDYAAPEILLGQPYDGRMTDAWALGVVLYALMEGRLPFDPPPNKAGARSRTAHRIARCDWMWVKFGDDSGNWDSEKGKGWEGARECVEALLKKASRGRKSVEEIAKMGWVQQGFTVEGAIKRRIEDEEEEADVCGLGITAR